MKKVIVIILIIFTAYYKKDISDTPNYQKDIASIYVYHSSFGIKDTEYKIDLENHSVWEFFIYDYSDYTLRDTNAENEGFTFVSELSEEKIQGFIRESARHGFTLWESDYYNEHIMDGHQWGITIFFADGTEKEIHGSNAYPDTWNSLKKDFEDLTGINILQLDSDWLDMTSSD